MHLIILTDILPDLNADHLDGSGFQDIGAPIAALLNVRGQLSNRALKEADTYIKSLKREEVAAEQGMHGQQLVKLDQRDWALPLGWKISRTELDYIRLLLGSPELCTSRNRDNGTRGTGVFRTIYQNSCATAAILNRLSRPKPPS